MSIVYVPLGEAKLCKSDCFSDLEISEATFYIFQNGGIPVGPFWCEPKMSSANTYLLKGKSKPAKINTQPTTSSRTLRFPLTWSRESPTNPYLCKVALSTYIVFPFLHQPREKKHGKVELLWRRDFRAEATAVDLLLRLG